MKRNAFIALAVVLTIVTAVLQAQTAEKKEPQLTVEDVIITISPGKPIGPEGVNPGTLCNLKVKLRNRGAQKANSFLFAVKINGRELPLYEQLRFMEAVDAGTTGEIALSSFYSTEGPVPTDGKLTVEVTLKEASWVQVKKEDSNTTVWTPVGEVDGLPVSKSVSKSLKTAR